MKTFAILLLSGILFSLSSAAQQNTSANNTRQELEPCIDFGVGYIPDKDYKQMTVSTSVNNWYLKRFGAFAMVELNFDSPAVIIGPTVSINHFSYVFTGIDFLTSRGTFNLSFKDARKDFGVGFYIKEWATIKIAYSFSAGPRAEVGIRIPLGG